jgi:alpha-beta hydrolase superfamily lysophospholipase
MFCPPQPLMHYPLDCGAGGLADNSLAKTAYESSRVPCVCAVRAKPRYVFVYFHGNSENLVTCSPFVESLADRMKSTVYALESPGYYATLEDESPSEAGCFAHADRFVAHIKETAKVPVVFLGYSMGCALALHAAYTHRRQNFPAAVALLSPFLSAASVRLAQGSLSMRLAPLWSSIDVFRMKDAALQQGHPTVVFGAANDEVIPPCHAQRIAELAGKNGPSEFHMVEGATHASIRSDESGVVYDALSKFLDKVVRGD